MLRLAAGSHRNCETYRAYKELKFSKYLETACKVHDGSVQDHLSMLDSKSHSWLLWMIRKFASVKYQICMLPVPLDLFHVLSKFPK